MVGETARNSRLNRDIIQGCLSEYALEYPLQLEVLESVVSTNDHVLAFARGGGRASFACIAEQQTGGRGRNGAVWESPVNANIYLSLGYYFNQFAASELSGLSLACGVSLARMLKSMGLEAQLKWPNDVLLEYRKLAGILIETRVRSEGVYVVIGLGMNVDMPESAGRKIDQPWVDLRRVLPTAFVQRNQLAAQLLDALLSCCAEYDRSGFASFLDDWHSFDVLSGHQVIVKTQAGERQAKVKGIDKGYGLRVEIEGVEEVFYAADVKLELSNHADD
ncbi:hypothetical protein MNBD_GAMMA11-553 [hydrothermal vent metagenome]|uniref:BPL/LPL catalytic domain-containing protein n=1 Tax=hydrothermal vent metagenome TaxID=652676 RepID=A0A3B0X9N2_9ZZZZ